MEKRHSFLVTIDRATTYRVSGPKDELGGEEEAVDFALGAFESPFVTVEEIDDTTLRHSVEEAPEERYVNSDPRR